jgi:hypothetical protein
MKLAAASLFLLALVVPASAQPPKPTTATDPNLCEWQWLTGGGIGVWAERCKLETGLWEVKFKEDLPGFVLTVDGGDETTVIQRFTKPADAGPEAILPELRKRGYIPDDDECVFEAAAIRAAPRTIAFFEIKPTGKRKADFDATPADEVPEPPCGEYGWSTHGVRYFMTDIRVPDAVVYINIGQDGLMFDDATVTLE